jgi:membrane protein implicated in regulation of membrane protease activity
MWRKIERVIMYIMPWFWMVFAFVLHYGEFYEQAIYALVSGVFFMVLPIYLTYLDKGNSP